MSLIKLDASEPLTSLRNISNNIQTELAAVSRKTAEATQSKIAKDLTQLVNLKQKFIKTKQIVNKQVGKTARVIALKNMRRVSLRQYGARQTKKGVSYKIYKSGKRKTTLGAFQGPRPGVMFTKYRGTVFSRVGQARTPIKKRWGPSPSTLYKRMKKPQELVPFINHELRKQLKERLRYVRVRRAKRA